jgi:uncharacterized small protein (DUF1192 family)
MGSVVDLQSERISRIAEPLPRIEAKLDQLIKNQLPAQPPEPIDHDPHHTAEVAMERDQQKAENEQQRLSFEQWLGFAQQYNEWKRQEHAKQFQEQQREIQYLKALVGLAHNRIAELTAEVAQLKAQLKAEKEKNRGRPHPLLLLAGGAALGVGAFTLYRHFKPAAPPVVHKRITQKVTKNVTEKHEHHNHKHEHVKNVTEKHIHNHVTEETHVHPTTVKQVNKPVPGEKGERGSRGATGTEGARGERGSRGARGYDGRDGRHGLHGLDGRNGRSGRDGRDGRNGRDGQGGRVTANNCVKTEAASKGYFD